jgi:hypothetical protein
LAAAVITNTPIRLHALDGNLLAFGASPLSADATSPRPIPAWHVSRRPETVVDTLAVLARARQLIADEKRWCQGSLARGGRNLSVPLHSIVARRHCARGAIMQAGCELGLCFEDAAIALERQLGRPIEDWNDHPRRVHAEVIAAFDAAVMALETSAG